jgi:hypothetical protein
VASDQHPGVAHKSLEGLPRITRIFGLHGFVQVRVQAARMHRRSLRVIRQSVESVVTGFVGKAPALPDNSGTTTSNTKNTKATKKAVTMI